MADSADTVLDRPLPRPHAALRWGQLVLGFVLFGAAIALMIQSRLGLGPWDAFHVGLHRLTGMSVGTASIVTGLAIVVGTLTIGIRPGPGTVANMVLIGVFTDVMLPLVPAAPGWAWGVAYYLGGIALGGIATGMYIAAGLGKGPRDGLMIGLSERSGWPVRRVRTLLEASVLVFGWWMGGRIGVGTVIFTVLIGPATQWGLELFGVAPATPARRGRAETGQGAARAAPLGLALLLGAIGTAPLSAQRAPAAVPALAEASAEVAARVRTVTIAGSVPEARGATIVLPRGYETSGRRYPVLYLLHGLTGDHTNWLERTNLVAYTADLPVIVVLPDAGDSWYANSVSRPAERFEAYIGDDVVAYVDRHFRTLAFREARYIAGLSMGGYGALKLALTRPQKFALAASFSGAFGATADTIYRSVSEVFGPVGSEARQAGDVLRLIAAVSPASAPAFYLDCGTGDRLLAHNRAVAAALRERGLSYEYHEVAGAHAWEYWNRRLPVVLELVRERVRSLPEPRAGVAARGAAM